MAEVFLVRSGGPHVVFVRLQNCASCGLLLVFFSFFGFHSRHSVGLSRMRNSRMRKWLRIGGPDGEHFSLLVHFGKLDSAEVEDRVGDVGKVDHVAEDLNVGYSKGLHSRKKKVVYSAVVDFQRNVPEEHIGAEDGGLFEFSHDGSHMPEGNCHGCGEIGDIFESREEGFACDETQPALLEEEDLRLGVEEHQTDQKQRQLPDPRPRVLEHRQHSLDFLRTEVLQLVRVLEGLAAVGQVEGHHSLQNGLGSFVVLQVNGIYVLLELSWFHL